MTALAHLYRVYKVLFVAQFQQAAQYRVQSVLWLLLAVIRPVVFLAAWSAAANTQGGAIGSYSIGDFAAYYVCLTLVSQLTMSWNAYDFELEVRQGPTAAAEKPRRLNRWPSSNAWVTEDIRSKVTSLILAASLVATLKAWP